MSKTIVIKEGGQGKQLTVNKLKTGLLGGGTCLWVPEDEVGLGTIHISKNGTYTAGDEGYYGFSEVTVSGIGKVSGRDPVTGENTEITTEKDPQTGEDVLVKKEIPSSIRIVTPPTRLVYGEGDLMEYTGMVVKAFLMSGTVFTDETYPDGIIPYAELDVPSVVPSDDDDSDEALVATDGIYYVSGGSPVECCTQLNTIAYPGEVNYLRVPTGVRFAAFYNSSGYYYIVAASKEDFLYFEALHTWNGHPEPEIEERTRATRVTVDGEDYFYATYYWYSPLPIPSGNIETNQKPDSGQLQVYAIRMMYGESVARRVPVKWTSPYGNGETYTDTFTITVNAAANDSPTP